MANNELQLNAAEQQQFQRRFPRAGYWLGMLDRHPDIHPVLEQMEQHNQRLNGNPYAGHLAAAAVPAPPAAPGPALPPMYAPNFPGFPGLYPNHGYYAPAPQFQPPPIAPLPYYRERAENIPPPAPACQARDRPDVDTSHIDVSVPRNTEVENGIVTRIIVRLPTDLAFNDFFERVCANMDLQPGSAVLGYKFAGDRVSDQPTRLANPGDLVLAMTRGIEKIKRARTREVILEIHNIRVPATKSKKGAPAGSTKKRAFDPTGDGNENDPDTTISYASQLRQLKEKLFCQKHDRHCYINPIDGEHISMNVHALTLWAKKILFNEATYQQPPSVKMFDHVPKKLRTAPPSKTTPPINIYVSPLGDVTHRLINGAGSPSKSSKSSARDSDTNDEDTLIHYPLVSEVLCDLHLVMPLLDYPQYVSAFRKNGVIYSNAALDLDTSFFVDVIGMPHPAVRAFIDHVRVVVRRARKGKGRAISAKNEKDNDLIILSD